MSREDAGTAYGAHTQSSWQPHGKTEALKPSHNTEPLNPRILDLSVMCMFPFPFSASANFRWGSCLWNQNVLDFLKLEEGLQQESPSAPLGASFSVTDQLDWSCSEWVRLGVGGLQRRVDISGHFLASRLRGHLVLSATFSEQNTRGSPGQSLGAPLTTGPKTT